MPRASVCTPGYVNVDVANARLVSDIHLCDNAMDSLVSGTEVLTMTNVEGSKRQMEGLSLVSTHLGPVDLW